MSDEELVIPLRDGKPIPVVSMEARGRRLASAVLAFYRVGNWDAKAQREWKELTGGRPATTKTLGDLARELLGRGEEK